MRSLARLSETSGVAAGARDDAARGPLRILYIDGVGPFGGASRSLYEVIQAMPTGEIEAYFVVQRGTILPYYERLARAIIAARGLTRFDNTRYGHYRGIRWLVALRELSYAPFTLMALVQARLRWRRVDVIHANEITEILPLLLARWLFRAPAIVHVRSLQRNDWSSRRSRWLKGRLQGLDAVVAIDQNVRSTLPPDVNVEVVHNSFTPQRSSADRTIAANLDRLRPTSLKIGFVGNLHHSKGLFDLVEAARQVHHDGKDVEYIIVGGVTRSDRGFKGWLLARLGFAQNVQKSLLETIEAAGLGDRFHLLGPTSDIQCVYERIDVLCFPSHFDAPGRPVFEAAFSGVPSIVAVSTPMPDTVIDGVTGLAVPMKDATRLAQAISHFAADRAEVDRMGAAARTLAERNFNPRTNATRLFEIYRSVARTSLAR
jgi:glycosyltransferase involved in cell wall biosynthesis